MNYTLTSATILLILITDPVGNIPIFIKSLRNVSRERRTLVIMREVLIAFFLLLAFMFVGRDFLTADEFERCIATNRRRRDFVFDCPANDFSRLQRTLKRN